MPQVNPENGATAELEPYSRHESGNNVWEKTGLLGATGRIGIVLIAVPFLVMDTSCWNRCEWFRMRRAVSVRLCRSPRMEIADERERS